MKITPLLLVFVPFLLIGCGKFEKSTAVKHLSYYKVDSLLDAQIKYLSSHHAQLQKKTDSEEVLMNMDSIQWVSALSVFRIMDINNPSLKDAYTVRDQLKDSASNLTILHYQLKEGHEQQPLKELSFYYLGTIQSLKKITAKTSFQRVIYNSHNEFEQSQKQTALRAYSIIATQKTMGRDSVKTIVDFQIHY